MTSKRYPVKKALSIISACLSLSMLSRGQDVHFTQYFASPLTLNPALTGLSECDFRLAANFRSQWYSVSGNPYTTGSFSYDMKTMEGRLDNGDAIGIGVLGVFDRAGQGALQQINIGVSLAYHKALGQDRRHTLSLGIQGALVQKKLDFSRLTFNDQYLGGIAGQATAESPGNADMSYPDFNAGLMYSGRIAPGATGYAGFSAYHITQPAETFLGGGNRINARYAGYIGSAISLGETMELYLSGLYQRQGASEELTGGVALGFILSNSNKAEEERRDAMLSLGGWYRAGDAVSPYISLKWSQVQVGISYDAGISGFNPATNGNSAYELSVIFNGCINRFPKDPRRVTCPRF